MNTLITISGVTGKGSLWGTFHLKWAATNPAYAQRPSLEECVPPGDWFLPPPDSKWYPVTCSPYGPRASGIKVGWINSVDKNSNEYNPCEHSTMTGDALYRGSDGSSGPYWSVYTPSSCQSTFVSSVEGSNPPRSSGHFMAVLKGKPCTTDNTLVYGYKGDKVKYSLSSSNDEMYRFYNNSILHSHVAPSFIQETLAPYGDIPQPGQWYGWNVYSEMIVPGKEHLQNRWFRNMWYRPSSNVFVRDLTVEYHSTDSYTPQFTDCSSGLQFLVEERRTVTTCVVTAIRSVAIGRFEISYDISDEETWHGWSFPSAYQGSKVTSKKGVITSVLVMEPGLTQEFTVPTGKADNYCRLAPDRANDLYNSKSAGVARLNAVNDVQELESNWIENLSGVSGTMDCLDPLIDGAKAVGAGDLQLARKALASGYLVYKYAIAPNISDAGDLKSNGVRVFDLATKNRFSNERRRGMFLIEDIPVLGTKATCFYTCTYHLRLKDNYFSQCWGALEKLGLDPSAGQMWALIPFSFVADWFAPIGDSLTNIDRYNSLCLNRDLTARIEGYKVLWPLEDEIIADLFDSTICSNGSPLKYSWYDRRVHHTMGSIDPIGASDGNGLSVSQMAQSAALLTQYLG